METLQKIACLRQLLGKVGVGLDDKYLVPQAGNFFRSTKILWRTKLSQGAATARLYQTVLSTTFI
jgi:hypothetical protein